ncbi:unnamed protein product [Macrosiphum euphorbiae]|uniref:Uncharacterized protein n=1 Tax=Macrosiphum euphorbiae TaxID=13131 RepID=A0AAV0WDV4_9HEMI|nr:unnamed protein product [Macrosiphum euphorbiae]
MSARTLDNNYKLIVKKRDYLSAENVSRLNSDQTKVQLDLLQPAFDFYNKKFEELMLTVEDEKIDTYIEGLEEVSDIYAHTKAILLSRIHKSEEPKPIPHESNVHQLIKLPPINLPIHLMANIDDVHRMYYLKSSLQRQAAEVIGILSVTALNYKEAWSLLVDRYDNKRLIVQKHLHYLLSQPVINSESANALRNLLDVTRKHLSALKVLELPVNHWDAILVHIVANRLPNNMRQTWEVEGHQGKKSCPVCSQSYHSIYQCPTFMQATPKDRKTLDIKARLCFNCLWNSHHTNKCSSSKVCKICTLKHHTLLHITSYHTSHLTSDKTLVSNKASDEQDVQAVSAEVANNVVVHHGTTQSTITSTTLLATALIHTWLARTLNWDELLVAVMNYRLRKPLLKTSPVTLQQFYLL